MGIKFHCQACGKKLNVKSFLAGRRGICPHCQAKIEIPPRTGSADTGAWAAASTDAPTPAAFGPPADLLGADEIALPEAAGQPASIHATPTSPAPASVAPLPAAAAGGEGTSPVQTAEPAQDPFAASPDANWFVRPPSGGQYGPAPSEVMRDWIRQGRVGAESMVWREGWAEWKKAAVVIQGLGGTPVQGASPPTGPAGVAGLSVSQPATTSTPPVHGSLESPLLTEAIVPVETTSSARSTGSHRRRSNTSGILVVVVLVLAVVVLLPVLIYVLMKQSSFGPDGRDTAWPGAHPPQVEVVHVGDSNSLLL